MIVRDSMDLWYGQPRRQREGKTASRCLMLPPPWEGFQGDSIFGMSVRPSVRA